MGNYLYEKVTASAVKQKPVIKTESSGKIILAQYPHLATSPSMSTSSPVIVDTSSIIEEGQQCVDNEDYENAIKLFDNAIVLNPNNHIPYNQKGSLLFKLEKYEEAIKAYDGAITANQKNQISYNGKGDVLFKLEKYEEAIECYDKALEINPNYLKVLDNKGLTLDKLGNYEEAIESF